MLLKIGVTAFGGPAAHIAMFEDECVNRRRWLTRERFLDFLGAINLLPGPNSTEMAIYLGYVRGGWAGLILGGACFILPSAILVTALAWAYVRFGALPQMNPFLYAVKPVIVAIIARALWRYSVTALKTPALVTIAIAATVVGYFVPHPFGLLAAAALVAAALEAMRHPIRDVRAGLLLLLPPAAAAPAVGLAPLFFYFLKVGTVLFGSGYVLFAFLRTDLVDRWHWVTNSQLLDAVAVGQVTPGPISTAATFLGYILAGPLGRAGGDDRHVSPGLCLCCDQRAAGARAAPLAHCRRSPGWSDRRVGGADRGGHASARAGRRRRPAGHPDFSRELRRPDLDTPEFRVADSGSGIVARSSCVVLPALSKRPEP